MFLWCFDRKKLVLFSFSLLFAACIFGFSRYGSEFIPSLNEGAVYIRATLPNSVNLDEAVRITKDIKKDIREFDEVRFVLTQTGRPNDGTDPTGFFNIEFHVELKPEREWKRRISKEEFEDELKNKLEAYPGIVFAFSQPIQDNVEEYVAGVKSALVINIYGDDIFELEDLADEVAASIQDVRGITDINVYRKVGLPELRIKLKENWMARYGVSMADAQAVVEMAIGGKAASVFYEDERMFDIRIRFKEEYRKTEEQIGNILIPTMDGNKVSLKEIAEIGFVTGPAFIYREGSSRYIAVGFGIEGRDLGSTITEARQKVENEVQLPPTNRMEWAGEFESKERATKQLSIIVPFVLLIILFLLYMNFGTLKDTLIAASTIPFAFIGGFLSLLITGTIFGISGGIGFIILFGVNAINGIILLSVMRENVQKKMPLNEAIQSGVFSRIRPIVMIALMGSMGLLPAALSRGMGSEIQKPLAIIIVGGLMVCMFLSIIVLPQIFYYAYKKDKK